MSFDPIQLTLWIVSFAVLLQSAEYLWIHHRYPVNKYFHTMIYARLLAAAVLPFFPHPLLILLLLITTMIICARWLGTFNGGSDYMTATVLLALLVALALPSNETALQGALWYISISTCLSYLIAGWVKFRQAHWRSGKALQAYAQTTIYGPQLFKPQELGRPQFFSRLLFLFECSFPVALISPRTSLVYIGLGLSFHLLNAYIFGLNRFFWAWAATYPALYHCSGLLSKG